jgi:twinkle protein
MQGGEKTLFGLDDIADAEQVIIVEGEMDKLAMEQAGMRNCVSVPDGVPLAPSAGAQLTPKQARRQRCAKVLCLSRRWIRNSAICGTAGESAAVQPCRVCEKLTTSPPRAHLDRVKTFVIAVDSDEPGQALAEELARRLGRERCFRVHWPGAKPGSEGAEPSDPAIARKDANEVLMKDGPSALAALVSAAEPVPIRGLFAFSDFADDIDRYYGLQLHEELRGVSTGWEALDAVYRVVPGELTIVTGVPNSGKSEWVDALMVNLATNLGWSFALCSMENKVHEHARKLIEKHVGRPFFDAEYANGVRRMSEDDLKKGKAFLESQFVLIRHEDDELPSIDWVLGIARAAVMRYGIRGLLIDPYNELDHRRPSNVSETEYVSQMLTRIKRFAAHNDVHVWFVAHPRQMSNWRGDSPGLYDISGSAHFVNKCDNGLVVHRNRTEPSRSLEVTVKLEKVRNKVAGRIGEAILIYDRANGRYMSSEKVNEKAEGGSGGYRR